MTLTRVEYFRVATLLPIVMPFPLGAILIGSALIGVRLPDWFGNAAVLAAMGMFLFAPVYVLLMGAVLLALRRCSWRQHALLAVVAPLLMLLTVGAFSTALDRHISLRAAIQTWAEPCLTLGYSYVVLTFLGFVALHRAGWFPIDVS